MPVRSDLPDLLLDTSVAVPLLVADHEHHHAILAAIGSRRVGLSGHAAFETLSVLSRLPGSVRRPPAVIAELMADNFPTNCYLSEDGAAQLVHRLAAAGIAGGSVYDGLVASAAREHDIPLMTRDRRALPTYRALDVRVEVLHDVGDR